LASCNSEVHPYAFFRALGNVTVSRIAAIRATIASNISSVSHHLKHIRHHAAVPRYWPSGGHSTWQNSLRLKGKTERDEGIWNYPPVPDNAATIYLTPLTHISLFAITMKAQCVEYPRSRTLLSSSMAEHSAVNRRVVGSSPTSGAKESITYSVLLSRLRRTSPNCCDASQVPPCYTHSFNRCRPAFEHCSRA
jgi:hypothetical protein